MLILLWGLATDDPLTLVRDELGRMGLPFVMLDQADVLATRVQLSAGREVEGRIQAPGVEIDLAAVTAAYVRPYDSRALPAIARAGPASESWRHATLVEDSLISWAEITPALVLNRFGAMAVNSSKPYQLAMIRRLGFSVPETLVTTDPAEAEAFWVRHGVIIYKSVSSVRSIVSRLSADHRDRLAAVTWCPTQFQQYIAGRDYRVHVVGDEVFAAEVVTAATDYRYPDGDSVEIRACTLPPEVAERCRRLASAMQLPVAGVDLRLSQAGEWYCFEVNPSPGFTYYQQRTGQPIGAAVARRLAAGTQASQIGLRERHWTAGAGA